MTPREIDRLEKDSIYTLRINDDLKDQVINGCLKELNKVVRINVKKNALVVLVIKQ